MERVERGRGEGERGEEDGEMERWRDGERRVRDDTISVPPHGIKQGHGELGGDRHGGDLEVGHARHTLYVSLSTDEYVKM